MKSACIAALVSACSAAQVFIAPGVSPMNAQDTRALHRAESQCKVYYPKSPCLKKFFKTGERRYQAICGRPE